MTSRALALAALLAICAPGGAPCRAQNCDAPASIPEMTECAKLRLRAAERAIGEVYGELLESEDKQFAQAVREAQEAWMRWREAEGRLAAKSVGDESLALMERYRLEARMSEERLMDLKAMRGN